MNLYSDGGARGNPGPAAIAFIATNEAGITLKADSCFIGYHTNNQAEYQALIMGLEYAAANQVQEVTCYLDSELVTKQVTGLYRIKNTELKRLNKQVKDLLNCFKQANILNVPREHPQITRADSLVNKKLDEQTK